jgi:hypothetical protein
VRVDDLGVTEPAAASEPGTAVTQPIPAIAGMCSQCAAPLAVDQRYCLHCGAPRAHVSGPISGGRLGGPPPVAAPGSPQTPPSGDPPVRPPGVSSTQSVNRNNTLALLAGIGVLLLAMGVGVLIGRAGAGSAKVPPAQVISVGGSAGASTTATTPLPTATATETPAATSAKKAAKAKATSSSGAGASIAKPAPPAVLKSVSKGQSGSSYEQKSKNLPDVVETG